jgi:hypothetical protein
VSAGLPWELKSVNDRIDMLEKTQSSLSKIWGVPKPTEQQITDIGKAYSQLCATVERTIEREIFGEVVFRYRDYIAVKNLQKVVGFSMTECDAIKNCSNAAVTSTRRTIRHQARQSRRLRERIC